VDAYRYSDVGVARLGPRVILFVVPTSSGAAAIACVEPRSDRPSLLPGCEAIVETLSLSGARPYDFARDGRFGRIADLALRRVAAARTAARRRVRAIPPREWKHPAAAVGAAFASAAAAVRGAPPPSAAARLQPQLVRALEAASRAYLALAKASRTSERAAYAGARAAAAAAEADIRCARESLLRYGFPLRRAASK
jgi:hypothetical protein